LLYLLTIAIYCQADNFTYNRAIKAHEKKIEAIVTDFATRRSFRDCLVTLTMSPSDTKKAAEDWLND
jgi:hypothetical protein